MSRAAVAAALAVTLLVGSSARADDKISGTVLTAEAASDPFSDGTSGAGTLVIGDKTGHSDSYSVIGTTKLTLDGKPISFDGTLVGDAVVKAVFDPQSKLLTVLDLKSAAAAIPWTPAVPKAAKRAAPGKVRGEVTRIDARKGTLTVLPRLGPARRYAVVETTTILRETAGGAAREIRFKTVAVGDTVEVRSRDGKTADQIRVRASAR